MYTNIDYSLPYMPWSKFDWNMEIIEVSKGGWVQFKDYAGNEWVTCEDDDGGDELAPDELPGWMDCDSPEFLRNEDFELMMADVNEYQDIIIDRLLRNALF